MEYSLKKIVHFVRPILQMVASRVLPNYKNTCFTSDQQPGKQGKCLYTLAKTQRKRHVPFPRFAWLGSIRPKPQNTSGKPDGSAPSALIRRTIISRSWLRGRPSLLAKLLRGKIRPQIFPVREQFPRLFPRVAVRRVSLFFLREQLTVFHIERLFRRELLQPKLVERTLCRAVPVDLLLMLF